MSTILISHNPPWIGIPENWPYHGWATATAWAEDLLSELARQISEPDADDRKLLLDYLVLVAESRAQRNASRSFIWIDGWKNPSYLADATIIPASLTHDITLSELAGSGDPDAIEAPIVEEFVSHAGLRGVSSVRYLRTEGTDGLLVRADYVLPVPEGHLRLYTAQYDLVAFERVKPKLAELAGTVSVVP
jgi:hypothetical protein